jgi:hypothetical protein
VLCKWAEIDAKNCQNNSKIMKQIIKMKIFVKAKSKTKKNKIEKIK